MSAHEAYQLGNPLAGAEMETHEAESAHAVSDEDETRAVRDENETRAVPAGETSSAPAKQSAGVAQYEEALALGRELTARPLRGGGRARVRVQHEKERMTVFERLRVLSPHEPQLLWHNWGRGLDGASIVTAVLRIGERDVAVYGHDFTLRAGSMDATNGAKLARC